MKLLFALLGALTLAWVQPWAEWLRVPALVAWIVLDGVIALLRARASGGER